MGISEEKMKIRIYIWRLLEKKGVARFPLPLDGRIPNFKGSEIVAQKVRELMEWRKADVIFCTPDFAQSKIRELALMDGKKVVMASPRLQRGYILIEPDEVRGKEAFASTIKGAFKYGKPLSKPIKVDLIIVGSVAVDPKSFYRLGKGGGYGDVEINELREISGAVPVITTVHDLQLVENLPHESHNTKVDIIVTPTKILRRNEAR
ncbi:MAG: 5-formyltetrahydrofolate cyclo-ligase [Candidatus Nanoarchaeia archaeon]|nr:5-formyltetrahydrofolate cyclo-ligase [Candidatus Haiyanarchaeum thermophilum]MCW1303128.1 5-formyltetrahydrofolate cyclo-ligase [Candidatus Haiyanarchaeum thermophilum]MCW1303793.1 5-formyltetrahydrofolate cyclo-ligase [Candidatus Haiyanarchaeum thermophilum]MCW1306592.1 5-formyltetrahydrofolate cyclo-ligase [Candidatus Haiyanarchaeum thermophilum]MCW1307004.1 5-formyltetrahydrofolate cyclo-ligase [Candidatus Haiyanarchaeum thermophilum]